MVDAIGQNVGINNSDPQSTLDVNGSFRLRPQVHTLSGTPEINMTARTSYLFVDGSADGPVTVNYSFAQDGDLLYIANYSNQSLVLPGGYSVPVGISNSLFSDGEWRYVSGDDRWKKNGNQNINPATDFIGTTDNQPLLIKTNNTTKIEVKSNGPVGVNGTGDNTGLELGNSNTAKQIDAGKIQYGGFGGDDHVVNIVGGGTDTYGTDRKVKIWAEGGIDMQGEIRPNGVPGVAGQILQSNGNGTMSWSGCSKYRNSRTYLGGHQGPSGYYQTYQFIVPENISEIWVEAWAGGDGGQILTGNLQYDCNKKGGDAGSYVSGIIKVFPNETLTLYVGDGGFLGLEGGISQVLRGSTILIGTTTFDSFVAYIDPTTNSDGVLKFVKGAKGQPVIMDYKQVSTTTFATVVSGGDGGEAYLCTPKRNGCTVAYDFATNLLLTPSIFGSGNHGSVPGGGGGTNLFTGSTGGEGMVILRW